jgi:O-antigen/teichoic acid export membrane protein
VAFSVVITGTTSLTTVFTGAFQAHRKMKLISVITVATDLLTSVAVILSLVLGFGLFGLMVASATVNLIMFGLTFIISRKLQGATVTAPTKKLWRYLLKEGFPIAIGSLGITLYLYVTSALLKYLNGNVAAGYYNAAFKFITILTVIPVSFTLVVYPFFAELQATDRIKLGSVLNTSVRYMFMISIPLAVGTIMIARNLVATVYTPEFLPSVPVLQILIISSMISYGNYVVYIFFPTVNRQRFGMFVTIPTGIVVAVANYILIPRYGILVPALSLVAVEIVLFTAANIYLARIGFPLHLRKIFLKPLSACLPMAISVYVLSNTSIFLQIVVAAIVYGISFYFMKGVLAEDKPILEKLLPSPIKGILLR